MNFGEAVVFNRGNVGRLAMEVAAQESCTIQGGQCEEEPAPTCSAADEVERLRAQAQELERDRKQAGAAVSSVSRDARALRKSIIASRASLSQDRIVHNWSCGCM